MYWQDFYHRTWYAINEDVLTAKLLLLYPSEKIPLVDESKIVSFDKKDDSKIIKALSEGYNYEAYKAYLLTKTWMAKRQLVFERDGFKCVDCGNQKHLNCHHLTYQNLGNEPLEDLITKCSPCHKKEHGIED